MKTYSVIIRDDFHKQLLNHLIRDDGQEDLCFATYIPSTGNKRSTAILSGLIFPKKNERIIHGNVSFLPQFFERALNIAILKKEGLMLLHSHSAVGWQEMSDDDIIAETRIAPASMGGTNFPLVGLTLGVDGSWSARFWVKNTLKKREYIKHWCESVRVIGKKLSITFNDSLLPPSFDIHKQLRTISAWGSKMQEDISRLKIGIVGLGSVGSIVTEILARTGISNFTLIDFDSVEEKNLDRLTNIFNSDIGRAKVNAVADGIKKSGTSPILNITTVEHSICEREGFEAALDCDILFSCVDRPWPRQVLNFIAYAHLIPVIDGGILVRTNKSNTKIIGADWKTQVVGFKRACLECLRQFNTEDAALEMHGKLDDPEYIKGIDTSLFIDAHENVFAFSSHLASMEVLQMLSLFISPSGISDVGQQMYHFVTGTLDIVQTDNCNDNCFFQSIIGKGDLSEVIVYGEHSVAKHSREIRTTKCIQVNQRTKNNHTKINKIFDYIFISFKKILCSKLMSLSILLVILNNTDFSLGWL
jgi:Dinucleotide-utilizing enzymes involved in molybdopterin and thiamine biosynthesis family 2